MTRLALPAGLAAVLTLSGALAAEAPDNSGLSFDTATDPPPAYADTITARDSENADKARTEGESHLPTLFGTPGPRRPTPSPPATPAPEPVPAYGVPSAPITAPAPEEPGEAGAAALRALIAAWTRRPEIVSVHRPAPQEPAGTAPDTPARPASARSPVPGPSRALAAALRAGRGYHARVLYAVDSELTAPVLVELLEPPLDGAVVTGSFTQVRDRLAIRFTRLDVGGQSHQVEAWAVGLDCACAALTGEVDRHLFARLVLPAAVAFAEGFLASAARAGESLTIGAGDDIVHRRDATGTRDHLAAAGARAAGTLGAILLENAPKRSTVRLSRNTELVVVFADNDNDNNTTNTAGSSTPVPARAAAPVSFGTGVAAPFGAAR